MKFSEKIIKIRKENGLSQEEFGNKINLSRQAISKWESEQSQPEVDKVKEISKVFGVSIEYLLNDELEVDIKIEDKKDTKKNKKRVFKVVIAVLAIYLAYCLFKFALLSICYIRANNISDYDNYEISIDSSFDNALEDVHDDECMLVKYRNGVQQIEYFYESNFAEQITYVNQNKNKCYVLNYDEELEKYVYEDLRYNEDFSYEEYEENRMTLKNITLNCIPNIFIASIDPRIKVWFDDTYFYIDKNFKKDYEYSACINKETGIFSHECYTEGNNVCLYKRIDFWIEDFREEIDCEEPIEYEEYVMIDEIDNM